MAQKKPTVYEFVPKLGQLRDDVLFGDVMGASRPQQAGSELCLRLQRGAACGAGGVMAWERGRGEGARGRGGC